MLSRTRIGPILLSLERCSEAVPSAKTQRLPGFALTTSSSPPASSVAGSGIPPSITHRFESYFVLMKFSIFLIDVSAKGSSDGGHHIRFCRNMTGCKLCFPVSAKVSHCTERKQPKLTNLFALAFPHFSMFCSCSSVQASRSTDLTRLICVPMPRCMPEHLMQTNIPRFQLAHRGSACSQH